MKRFLPLFGLLALSAGPTAFGQAPATTAPAPAATPASALRPHSVSLSVGAVDMSGDNTPTGGEVTMSNSSQNRVSTRGRVSTRSTSTRTVTDSDAVQITVRNFGHSPDTVKVEWYWIAAGVGTSATGSDYILDQGSKDVSLAANGSESFNVESKAVGITEKIETTGRSSGSTSRTGRSSSSRSNRMSMGKPLAERQSGSMIKGWMVRVLADGKTIAASGSSATYESTVKDEERLKTMKETIGPQTGPARKRS